jgi:hypothetical protein
VVYQTGQPYDATYVQPAPAQSRPPRRRRGMLIAAVVIAALALAGGGVLAGLMLRGTPTAQPTQPAAAAPATSSAPTVTTPAAPVPLPTSFLSAADLVNALNANGLPCGPAEEVGNPSLADSLIDCGPTVVAAVYSSARDAEGGFTLLVNAHKGISDDGDPWSVHMAVGSNWTVNADEAYAKKAAELFGGQYRTESG